ncbi:hypothetical protein, partial [Streptomyces stelliscabiei]|uniref:hypothetical protein n=1 Tax=Streptomyces stelliscabiei TaxID=146820 RepID=UPI001F20192B
SGPARTTPCDPPDAGLRVRTGDLRSLSTAPTLLSVRSTTVQGPTDRLCSHTEPPPPREVFGQGVVRGSPLLTRAAPGVRACGR